MVVSKLIVIENEMRKGEIQMSGKLCVLRYQITEDEFLKELALYIANRNK